MMIVRSYLVLRPKFRKLIPHFHFSLSFHQFVPSKPSAADKENQSCPNLLNHKDWLSQPEIIRIFQNLKDPHFALPLFSQLSSRKDYKPNESIYATVIHKLTIAKDFDAIEKFMDQIKLERKCRLSDAFFRNLIKIYGHSAGRINKAIETLFDMPNYKCWPSTATFNCVLNLLVSTKQFEVVHEVYSGASRLGVEVDACCLNIIIKGLCECGQIEAAYKVLDEFPEQKCTPNTRTFSTIMHGLCARGRVDESFKLLERMETEGVEVDSIVFNILISGLRKQGRVKEGVELFDRVMLRGVDPNPGTYQEVLYCLLDGKSFLEAKVIMENMLGKGINPSFVSYKRVIRGFCGEKCVGDVEWALRRMVVNGFVPKMGMWKEIVRCVVSDKHGSFLDVFLTEEEQLGDDVMEI